jgi:molybdate transport system substrate-binding protein
MNCVVLQGFMGSIKCYVQPVVYNSWVKVHSGEFPRFFSIGSYCGTGIDLGLTNKEKKMKHFFCSKMLVTFLVLLFLAKPALAVETVLVYAAASTNDVLSKIIDVYNSTHNSKVKASFASSSTLAKQIEAGAPAQIYISANPAWMDYLQQGNMLVKGTRTDLLINRLVLVAPLNSKLPIAITADFDLPRELEGRLCLGDPEHVPAGIYAKQALDSLGWWRDLRSNIVAAANVRAALAFVERGECAAGIVYATDVGSSKKVTMIFEFPHNSHKQIVYPVALLNSATVAAYDFYSFLQSPAAIAIFKEFSFTTLK